MSIQIANFSLDAEDWTYADSSISVDITDLVHSVTTSGCYFEVNGATVSSTLVPISNGYRMTYDPADNFASLGGPTEFRAYGSNDNNDILYRNLYVTFGYIVEMNNRSQDGWDLGFNSEVVVRASAENMASCPIKNAEAFWFTTEDNNNRLLGASIVGIPRSSSDLSASIYPQSTAFFYGKTYKIVLRASDFAGNEMEPFEFEFKIEDKP
jgi:hypothetical protein